MANKKRTNKSAAVDETLIETTEVVAEAAEEPTEETTEKVEAAKEDTKPEPAPKEEVEDEKSSNPVYSGVVTGCAKLNVRKGPGKDFPVVRTLPVDTKVVVKDCGSDEWYKIPGQGFVMKAFITIK